MPTSRTPRRSRWLAHLNVLLPVGVAVFYGAMPILAFVSNVPADSLLGRVLLPAYVLAALAVPAWLWWKGLLLPRYVAPERRMLYGIGHALVALANVVVGATIGGPLFYAWWTGDPDYAFYALFGIAALVFAVPACIAGLVCVHASHGSPEPEGDA